MESGPSKLTTVLARYPTKRAAPRHFGQLMLEASYPLFPLLGSGVDDLGSHPVDEVSDLELGLPQELGIGFGREQGGKFPELVVLLLPDLLVDVPGPLGLLGRKMRPRHEGASVNERRRNPRPSIRLPWCIRFSTYFRDAHPWYSIDSCFG
jgi:hypothetical protein